MTTISPEKYARPTDHSDDLSDDLDLSLGLETTGPAVGHRINAFVETIAEAAELSGVPNDGGELIIGDLKNKDYMTVEHETLTTDDGVTTNINRINIVSGDQKISYLGTEITGKSAHPFVQFSVHKEEDKIPNPTTAKFPGAGQDTTVELPVELVKAALDVVATTASTGKLVVADEQEQALHDITAPFIEHGVGVAAENRSKLSRILSKIGLSNAA